MGDVYLLERLQFLRSSQNPDGGWGYFPGKQSWLEPTAWAMLALQSDPEPVLKAKSLIRQWQRPDGAWRPNAQVPEGTWITALPVLLATCSQDYNQSYQNGLDWLLSSTGAETGFVSRVLNTLHLSKVNLDTSNNGWPWRQGNSAWVEPTVHTLVALRRTPVRFRTPSVSDRIRQGEAMLWSRRGRDGGWNYGSPQVLKIDLPSYPETTALALIGLHGRPDLGPALDFASKLQRETRSPLAQAWLRIALRLHGRRLPDTPGAPLSGTDIQLAAIEAIGRSDDGWKIFA